MSQETFVLFANEAFYLTFTTRDADSMSNIWSSRDNVTCIHPGWQPLMGREVVMKSWHDILANPRAPEIRCGHASVHIEGTMAYVLCAEILPGGQLAATNIFVLEDGAWKMVHHQAGPMPRGALESKKSTATIQ